MKKILVFSPHFDDEVLLCGATLAKLKGKVKVVVKGLTYSEEAYSGKFKEQHIENQAEAEEMAKRFNAKIILPSGRFNDMHLEEESGDLQKELICCIREEKPDIVITTHYEDFHCDHRIVGKVAKEAVYQSARKGICGSVKEMKESLLLLGEVDLEGITNLRVNIYSEVDEKNLKEKIAALKCYKSFVQEHPLGNSIFSWKSAQDWVMSIARLRGMHCGVNYAEVFEVGNIRGMLKLEDVF